MKKLPVLSTLRELASCYQAFERYSGAHLRTIGMTPAQFDIIATLGNTAGMSCRELGERTLITKGTLTGVLDRLEARGLVRRDVDPSDGRSLRISLTGPGEREYERCFPQHAHHITRAVAQIDERHLQILQEELARLRKVFEAA